MTNSQRLDVDAMHEKDFGSNSVASLSRIRNLVRTPWRGRAVFAKPATVDTIDDYSQYIYPVADRVQAHRRARLRCYYIAAQAKVYMHKLQRDRPISMKTQ